MQIFTEMDKQEKRTASELFDDFLHEMAHVCGYADHDKWDADDWDAWGDMVLEAARR